MTTSEEASFLAAIKANPQDDAPRLVYADWLDEHGRRDEAEIIRVECTYRQARAKLFELQGRVDSKWGFELFPSGQLVLVRYPEDQKISVIKVIRELTGLGLADAKQLSETLPALVGPPMSLSRLKEAQLMFGQCEATFELRLAIV